MAVGRGKKELLWRIVSKIFGLTKRREMIFVSPLIPAHGENDLRLGQFMDQGKTLENGFRVKMAGDTPLETTWYFHRMIINTVDNFLFWHWNFRRDFVSIFY